MGGVGVRAGVRRLGGVGGEVVDGGGGGDEGSEGYTLLRR